MPLLPVMLDLTGRTVVIIGGGQVALRRATSMLDAGADITVIAPQIDPKLEALDLRTEARPYQHGDLNHADLVVIASNNPDVNQAAAREAADRSILINRTDAPDQGNVMVPAHRTDGPITLAVYTGTGPRAAAAIRDQLFDALDPDCRRLLEAIEPYRREARDRIHDPARRKHAMERMTGDDAMQTLKSQGARALQDLCREALADHEER